MYVYIYYTCIVFAESQAFWNNIFIQKRVLHRQLLITNKVRNESQVFFFRDVHNGILTYLCNKSVNTHNTVLKIKNSKTSKITIK